MNRIPFFIMAIMLLILPGCIEAQHLEKLGIIHTRGVDVLEDGKIESTMSIFQFEAQSQKFTKIVSGKGDTVKGTVIHASKESNYKLVPGKLQLDLYSVEVAEKGLSPYLDTLRRDANIPDAMYLALSRSKAKEIMMTDEAKVSNNIGQYLQGLIEENAQDHHFPKVSLQEFLSTINLGGKDAILPIFSIGDSDVPEITSIGIFKEDSYVGEVSIKEMELFNLMEKSIQGRFFELELPTEPLKDILDQEPEEDKFNTAYNIEYGKGKIIQKKDDKLSFTANITIDLNLLETSQSIDLGTPDAVKKLEKQVQKAITSRYDQIFSQLQEMGSDPFGFGIIYRINQPDGKLGVKEWHKIFPDIKVEFNVNAKVIRHGTVDK
ncbi:spore germination protein [Oceanobacillus limi]|uniref:Spore germination protein n=1 Tax=Oceanobacillus limi TaxID=930131 RepID=A0A1H9YGW7_9BACI|nr:Ger(x)C family spore germination protein [Oceanobacillus limi]SES68272.1 spore germination protein [Oceanobacillus limi]